MNVKIALRSALLITALTCIATAHAQTTYRWVDKKSGRTVYSDQPPPAGINATVNNKSPAAGSSQIPYAARQAAERFPVTLYTSADCVDLCKQARDLLNKRGVPFTEKMMRDKQEIDDLNKRFGGQMVAPSISIGSQNLLGLDPTAWNNILDLAGYPATAPYGSKPSGAFTESQ